MPGEQPKGVRKWFSMPSLRHKKSQSAPSDPAAAPPARDTESSTQPVSSEPRLQSEPPPRLSLRARLSKLSLRPKSSTVSTAATSSSTQDSENGEQTGQQARSKMYPQSEGRFVAMPTSQAQETHSYTRSTPRSIKDGATKLGGKLTIAWTAFKLKHKK